MRCGVHMHVSVIHGSCPRAWQTNCEALLASCVWGSLLEAFVQVSITCMHACSCYNLQMCT